MRIRDLIAGASALMLAVAPTAASAANPAAKLSVAAPARASAAKGDSKLLGMSGFLPVVILAALAITAIVVLNDDDNDSN